MMKTYAEPKEYSIGAIKESTANCAQLMGRDSISVVDANLKVYGIENLRIAVGSIMARA